MTKEFIPYEQALELKQLGFDEPCLGYHEYDVDNQYPSEFYYHKPNVDSIWNPLCINSFHPNDKKTNAPKVSAPLYQQAFRFFREKYELTCWVYNSHMDRYYYTILQYGRLVKANAKLETYEEAEHACLLKLIELAKQK